MALRALALVCIVAAVENFTFAGSTDPCTSYVELPRAKYRGGRCQIVYGKEVCDRALDHLWYKAVGLNGLNLEIQTTPAKFGYCGTKFPFWMNGTHPTVAEQEVNRTVCQTDKTDCDKIMNIMVKNCSGFYVYKLNRTDSCSKGYCFGETEPCPPVDPCDVFEYNTVSYDPARSFNCSGKSGNCGNYNDTLWYAFGTGVGFLNISTTCPKKQDACGSSSSLWINDTRNLANGSDEHTICLWNNTDCCGVTYKILSKWCKTFRVYNFAGLTRLSCRAVCTDDRAALCPPIHVPPVTTQSSNKIQNSTKGQTADEHGASATHTKTTTLIFYHALLVLAVLLLN